jgi:prevent-host-death family protein
MTIVGAFEAKTKLSELLDRVEKGEEITITRHGRVVARLVPGNRPESTPEERDRLMRAFWARPNRPRLDGLSIKEMIEEGRR